MKPLIVLSLILLTVCGLELLPARGQAIKTFPLDDQTVYHLKVATDKITTLIFPQPITALEGSDITADPKIQGEDFA